ncbi:hypothetical protein DYB28_002669 [Aphanomyces astaci]|uniref:Uncharacterized protein n=1 Tax=Aphanomyces astaci TaxID=112090 RepID=A0A9X8E3G4_APHAT|nr:hypothetical protein DYB28_002669 [Aphanomyces astaci]
MYTGERRWSNSSNCTMQVFVAVAQDDSTPQLRKGKIHQHQEKLSSNKAEVPGNGGSLRKGCSTLNPTHRPFITRLLIRMIDHKTLAHGSCAMVDFTNTIRPCSNVASRIKGHSGINLKHESVAERLKKIPKTQRTTFRSTAAAMNMS